jgi:hypothetical protein
MGQRPTWANASLEINNQMDLVYLPGRTTDVASPVDFNGAVVVCPANLHLQPDLPSEVAMRTKGAAKPQ